MKCVCVLAALQHHSQTATWERSQQSSWERSQVAWSEHYTIYNAASWAAKLVHVVAEVDVGDVAAEVVEWRYPG